VVTATPALVEPTETSLPALTNFSSTTP